MKRLFASLLIAVVAAAQPGPATARGEDRIPTVADVNRMALVLTMNQIFFAPDQLILLAGGGAYGAATDDVERIDEPQGDGLFAQLFEANKIRVFEALARKNFVDYIGRAYRIGDLVFVDTMFFGAVPDVWESEAGLEALAAVLGGGVFAFGPDRFSIEAFLQPDIFGMMFFMRTEKFGPPMPPNRLRAPTLVDPALWLQGDTFMP